MKKVLVKKCSVWSTVILLAISCTFLSFAMIMCALPGLEGVLGITQSSCRNSISFVLFDVYKFVHEDSWRRGSK